MAEPTGRYARRAAFLYEWFTDRRLDVADMAANVGYVDAIDAEVYLAAHRPERVRRWRVNDNLPGVSAFCPMVYLVPPAEREWLYDVAAGVRELDDAYGPELLLHSASWLTVKESRASFAIEHEADKEDRVKRFAAAISEYSGRLNDPLSPESLVTLQKAVLGDKALRVGVRRSPVFVGQNSFQAQLIHYIAPGETLVDGILEAFSRPFMQRYAGSCRFGQQRTCPDQVETNFEFLATEDAQHAWRYLDLSEHARYLSAVLRQTVAHEMAAEALALRQYDEAREAIKRLVEMPDGDADRNIRSLKQENWQIGNTLRKDLPQIFQEGEPLYPMHEHIVAAVRAAFDSRPA